MNKSATTNADHRGNRHRDDDRDRPLRPVTQLGPLDNDFVVTVSPQTDSPPARSIILTVNDADHAARPHLE
jgi:hypothetical protein